MQPRVRHHFPCAIRDIEHAWVPLPDGHRLAARIWLPVTAADTPVPALLEYLPYRKSDGTVQRDALRHPYLAGHGYAAIRVDMRGSGDADGILRDEYLPQEQEDALALLAWIAAQPWCNGRVGIFGKSWGGFNALQIAACRPPQLQAVIAMHFTDDRYADDVHYMGGCLLTSQMAPWAATMLSINALPPDPRFWGEAWRAQWLQRLAETPPYIHAWLQHQRRDAYWQHGSVGEDYSRIEVPVLAVGGWADAYNNAIPRLLAGLSGHRQAIIGPWSHNFPETGIPGPAIGFLQESVRWWDQWLKDEDTGILAEPMLRCWMPEAVAPASFYAQRPGRWVAETTWPSPRIRSETWYLNTGSGRGALDQQPTQPAPMSILGVPAHGLDGGSWGATGVPGEPAGDQRAADGECLTFTSPPAAAPVEILGRPLVVLTVAADRPLALLSLRLCDVAPDGASTLVTWGLLNLTHRDGHARPAPLTPGVAYQVEIPLNVMAHRLPAGHCWRLGISPTNMRHAWPSPEPVRLTVTAGAGCRLQLPVRPPRPEDAELRPFPSPETSPPLATTALRTGGLQQRVERDALAGQTTFVEVTDDGSVQLDDSGLEMDSRAEITLSLADADPLSLTQQVRGHRSLRRGSWSVRVDTETTLTADATHFWATCALDAYEGRRRVFARRWHFRVARDMI